LGNLKKKKTHINDLIHAYFVLEPEPEPVFDLEHETESARYFQILKTKKIIAPL